MDTLHLYSYSLSLNLLLNVFVIIKYLIWEESNIINEILHHTKARLRMTSDKIHSAKIIW
jgi:hypothetical protein